MTGLFRYIFRASERCDDSSLHISLEPCLLLTLSKMPLNQRV